MTDATDILAAAGVRVPEVHAYRAQTRLQIEVEEEMFGTARLTNKLKADAALRALAREVARLSGELTVACKAVHTWQRRAGIEPDTIGAIRDAVAARYLEEAGDDGKGWVVV